MSFARLKVVLVAALVASTALFTLGVALERSATSAHQEASPPTASPVTAESSGTEEGGGESVHTGEVGTTETGGSDATFVGLDLESWPLVAIATVVSLALAAVVWFRPGPAVFGILVLFGAVFAILDIAEVAHQVKESRAGLAVLAGLVAMLHLFVASLAGLGLRTGEA